MIEKIKNKLANLNYVAMFLIIFAYVVIITVVLMLITPSKNYAVSPGYEHKTEYSDIDTYITIRNTYLYSEGKILSTLATRYYVSTNTSEESKQDYNATIVKANVSAVTTAKSNYFFTDQTSRQTPLPVSTNIYYSKEQKDAYQLSEVSFEIRYFNKEGKDSLFTKSEKMFSTPKSKAGFGNETKVSVGGEDFEFFCINTAETADGLLSMRLTSTDKLNYHFDMQTWIVSKDGKVYPFVGVYGYSEGASFSTSNESLPRQMEGEYILCKAIIYNNGEVGEIACKLKISELKNSYN